MGGGLVFHLIRVGPDGGCVSASPAIIDPNIAAFRPPEFLQPVSERGDTCLPFRIVGSRHQYTNAPRMIRRLLRPRRERPCGRNSEQRDERAPLHSITSSARASRVGGTSRPSAFAVLRLITSSYLVGACTGKSAGLSPLRMRST